MTTTIEYALLSGAAYESTREKPNKIPAPDGWDPLGEKWHTQNGSSGFEAVAFIKGKDIVISFAGTYPPDLSGDWTTNAALGAGQMAPQLIQAALYYEDIKKTYPESQGYHITFTGHSLGGGLAGLMAVFFNKPATTFDSAPFRQSANKENALQLQLAIKAAGFASDEELERFVALYVPVPGPNLIFYVRGENNVASYAVRGEALSVPPVAGALRIGQATQFIEHGALGASPVDLHAQQLYIALKQCENLRQATYQLPFLVQDIFDSTLFAHSTDTTQRDLLNHLVRREFGVPGESGSDVDLLTKFGNDMVKIGVFGAADNDIKQALERIAFAAYYQAETGPFDKEFFEEVGGGLRFDMSDMTGYIKGYADLKTWLASNGPAEAASEFSQLDGYQRFTIALDKTLNAESPLDDKTDFMISGANGGKFDGGGGNDLLVGRGGVDTLKGNTGADTLYGGAGDDVLEGGTGDDILNGGEGNDTYIWNEGDGNDQIIDSDGKGRIVIQGAGSDLSASGTFTETAAGSGIWTSPDGSLTLTNEGGWKLATQSGGQIELNGFTDGNFGIHLKAVTTPSTYDYTLTGDILPTDTDKDGIQAAVDALGNPLGTNQPYEDILVGSAGNDHLLSGELSDNVGGRGGDDWIESGNGSDYVDGDEGNDLIEGGTGSDIVLIRAANDSRWEVAA